MTAGSSAADAGPDSTAAGASRPDQTSLENLSTTAGLDPVLLDVLACPADHHAPLRAGAPDDPAAAALTCTECGRVFPIRDGIPVLLLDDALGGPSDEPVGA